MIRAQSLVRVICGLDFFAVRYDLINSCKNAALDDYDQLGDCAQFDPSYMDQC